MGSTRGVVWDYVQDPLVEAQGPARGCYIQDIAFLEAGDLHACFVFWVPIICKWSILGESIRHLFVFVSVRANGRFL